MPQDPSFYCENCGRKVSSGMDRCPGCGQEFDSVLCPSCGFKGASILFKQNCPQCGYKGVGSEDMPNKKKQLPYWLYKVLIVIMVVIIVGLIRILFFQQ